MLRRTPVLLLLLVLAAPLLAQPVFDAQSSTTALYTAFAPTTTLAHTTTTDANRILLVSLHINTNTAPSAAATSVTYAGLPLTLLATQSDAGTIVRTEVWYLLAPPSGTHDVVATIGGLAPGDDANAAVGATTYSNTDQLPPATAASTGVGDPATVTIASETNDVIIDFISGRENMNVAPDFQTQGYDRSTGNNPRDLHGSSSSRAAASPATTMSWDVSHARPWALIAVRLRSITSDLVVTKVTNDPGPDGAFAQGETLTYTITVTNNGPARATNVVVTDPLPAGYSFTSVSPGAPACTESAGTVTCTFPTLASAATTTITINGTIATSQTQLVNTASATANQPDPNTGDNSATATAFVLAPTVVELLEIRAVQDSKGKVAVSWTTSFEADNLGFNLYRQTRGGRVQVNKHLIAGSALFAAKHALTSGRAYRWQDRVKDGEFAQYFLEDVDLDGTRTLHGPVTPALVGEVAEGANTDTLASLGSEGGIFVSPRGIGASPVISGMRGHHELAGQPAMKLMVTREGWYRVTFAELAAAGFAPGRKLALFTHGVEQPIVVTNDAIEFYGRGLDTPSSGARAYWLTNDKGVASRVARHRAKPTTQTVTNTPFTYERIERTVFFTALTSNGDRENFFGAIVTSGGATQELWVENADRASSDAALELTLQGATEASHRVRLMLGSHDLGTVRFNGMSRHVASVYVPLRALADGVNTLTLTALDGDMDVSVVESLRLTYAHRLVADNDALKVELPGGTSVTIAGFTSARVRAIDVTYPAQPVEVAVELANGNATLTAPGDGTRTILVLGDSRVLAPAQLVPSRPSTWSSTRNAADLVIITARPFAGAAEPLKARREREGFATVIVDVEDLYDEFNFGHRGPGAIRSFLEQTRHWARAPKYVLLFGDASIDPRDYLGFGTFDFVPTKLVPTFYLKTASDEWFVDGLQIAIGRLPARTVAEAETMVQRLVERDTAGNDRVSFVVDPQFDAAAAALGSLVPISHPRTFAANANGAFESLLLTYIGHGSTDLWNTGWFTGAAAAQLNNAKQPIVAALTCLNGYFHDVYMSSLAEALLTNPNGGAAAVWASSTLTEPEPQVEMARAFYAHLFSGSTIGEAAMRAKSATADRDVRSSWILFGDPTMRLR